jgi:hypothetical protein
MDPKGAKGFYRSNEEGEINTYLNGHGMSPATTMDESDSSDLGLTNKTNWVNDL